MYIPDDPDIVAAVRGAILALGEKENWEKYGAIEPEDIASAMFDMLWDYQESVCVQVGTVVQFAGVSAPDKWLMCDGAEVAQADYPDLFAVVGHSYGISMAGNFKLPDTRGRAVCGAGNGPGLTGRARGDQWGQQTRALGAANNGPHVHTTHGHLASLALMPGEGPVTVPSAIPDSTGSQGSGAAFGIMQPSTALNCMIRALR